jgi:hypothetical protein
MSLNFFKNKPYLTGSVLGAAAFGIELYTTPVVLKFATTLASFMSSFIGAVPALYAGVALTAGLHIAAGILLALAFSKLFAAKQDPEAKKGQEEEANQGPEANQGLKEVTPTM